MEKRTLLPVKALLCSTVLLGSAAAFAATPPSGAEAVVLTGWLHVEGYTMADVVVEVEVNGTIEVAKVTENGRFEVTLPGDTEATLRIEKPGHLPKEITVDTRNSRDGKPGQRRVRHVSFAVIMQLERHMAGLRYTGPVGNIGFDQGGGCLAVAHNKELVPASRQAPMVF